MKAEHQARARELWDGMADPSSRKVEKALAEEGIHVSYRTIARWEEKIWRHARVMPTPDIQARAQRVVASKINEEAAKIPPETMGEANAIAAAGGLQAAVEGGGLTDADRARIETRRQALNAMTDEQRQAELVKAREVMNIILMEEATIKGHVMTLMPKDTGTFIEAMTDAAKSVLVVETPIGETPAPGMKPVEGRVIDHQPANPVTDALNKFLASSPA